MKEKRYESERNQEWHMESLGERIGLQMYPTLTDMSVGAVITQV